MDTMKIESNKLSDFILALQDILKEHGDLEVVSRYDGEIFPAYAVIYDFREDDNEPLRLFIGYYS